MLAMYMIRTRPKLHKVCFFYFKLEKFHQLKDGYKMKKTNWEAQSHAAMNVLACSFEHFTTKQSVRLIFTE